MFWLWGLKDGVVKIMCIVKRTISLNSFPQTQYIAIDLYLYVGSTKRHYIFWYIFKMSNFLEETCTMFCGVYVYLVILLEMSFGIFYTHKSRHSVSSSNCVVYDAADLLPQPPPRSKQYCGCEVPDCAMPQNLPLLKHDCDSPHTSTDGPLLSVLIICKYQWSALPWWNEQSGGFDRVVRWQVGPDGWSVCTIIRRSQGGSALQAKSPDEMSLNNSLTPDMKLTMASAAWPKLEIQKMCRFSK